MGHIGLITIFSSRGLQVDALLSRLNQDSGHIFGKNGGVKVLADGFLGKTGLVFQFKARKNKFVIFLNRPTMVVKVSKD